jgi:hypothetical protein
MLETTCKINGVTISLLINPGATERFISLNSLFRCGLVARKYVEFDLVCMYLRAKEGVG